MLKPALSRGEIQCIGATTLDEYRKNIEKDGALERRFQKIMVEPTTPEETLQILNNIKGRYEDHHNVTYTDDALEAVSYTHLRAHETGRNLVCRLLLEKKKTRQGMISYAGIAKQYKTPTRKYNRAITIPKKMRA